MFLNLIMSNDITPNVTKPLNFLSYTDQKFRTCLSVKMNWRVSLELVPDQVGVVGGGDVVLGERLVHVHLALAVQVDAGVGRVHQIPSETLKAELVLSSQKRVRFMDLVEYKC